jgi:hypothetical protein
MRKLILIAVLAAGFCNVVSAEQFTHVGIYRTATLRYPFGARAQAMGGAMAAAWGSPGSVRWNPAAPVASREFSVEASHEETLGQWDRWTHAASARVGDVTIMLAVDDWVQEPYSTNALGSIISYQKLNSQAGWLGVSWRALTWQGLNDRKTIILGGGTLRFRSGINSAYESFHDYDLGAVFSWEHVVTEGFGLIQFDLGAVRTNIFENHLKNKELKSFVPAAIRVGGRAIWRVAPELQVTTTMDWEHWRSSGEWIDDAQLSVGIEMVWMDLFAFRYGVRDEDSMSLSTGRAFGVGFRYAVLNDQLMLRADITTVDMNESFGFDTTEVWTIGASWLP